MAKRKKALITGITGQDGSYLMELLLAKGYEVHGIVRRVSSFRTDRIASIVPQHSKDLLFLHYGDLTDTSSLSRLIERIVPDEIYHLGAQSHVRISFDVPLYTAHATGLGTLHLLEAIRETRLHTKFYQAGSSEMFGKVVEKPQKETTPFYPRSPYGVAKVFAHWMTKNYREAYGLHASNGIFFNHESPRRGENFVTRKITISVAEILAGKRDKIFLGNLKARRDWGYAPEYVEAMWRILQQDKPDDYVIATGEHHSVGEFVEEACRLAGLSNWRKYIEHDSRYLRPTEVDHLVGDASKARRRLGWKPKTTFKDLVRIMLEADCERLGVKLPYQQ